ncbi:MULTISPECIES: CapA family protein [Oscillatoriales]|uniref:CapA family protein n=1 Tax=Oscillatoriales TaxID=1150 RepID=UPI0001C38589|nr:capsular biosynthesis protein [Arthrospira platensis str. Paraca]MDT9311639.1 CapA family protein [Limnospira sp. Paracas R14]
MNICKVLPQKLLTLISGSLFLVIMGCDILPSARVEPIDPEKLTALTKPPKPYTQSALLIAVGDIMMHGPQIRSGYNPSTNTYNYDPFFTEVSDILQTGDWVIGNLETTLAGSATGYTGYPLFNAPDTLADALKNAGFNILTTANNHSLDRREAGLLKTLENVRSRGLVPVGTAASQEEADTITVIEKNDISMAFFAYTYGTNGIPIPRGKDYLVNLIDEAKIIQDIQKARELGVDIVTVALHFGTEYQRQPNAEQKRLVASLVNAGADIILGSHPHVVQPYQIFDITEEDGTIRQAVAIYSMGNFISNQRGNYRDVGVIFKVRINKNFPDKTIEIAEVIALPTWVHRYSLHGKLNYRILPLESLLNTQDDPLLTSRDYSQLARYLEEMNRHLASLLPTSSLVGQNR